MNRVILIASVLAAFALGYFTRDVFADREIAEVRAEFSDFQKQAATAARLAEADARSRESALRAKIQEVSNEARQKARELEVQLAVADTDRERLRNRIQALLTSARNQAGGDPALAAGGSVAEGAATVLADLFTRADARAQELAEHADRLTAARDACERSYQAVRPQLAN